MKKLFNIALKISGVWCIWGVLTIICYAVIRWFTYLYDTSGSVFMRLYLELMPLLCMLMTTLYFTHKIEKAPQMITLSKKWDDDVYYGLTVGLVWIGIPVLILLMMGNISFGTARSVSLLPLWIISIAINAIFQEYIFRGYIFQLLKRDYSPLIAILVTTALSLLTRYPSYSAGIWYIANVVMMSVFMSMLLLYSEGLLLPIIVHSVWNIMGFLSGCTKLSEHYVGILTCTISGNSIISGGEHKLEGSVLTLSVSTLGTLILIFLQKKKKRKE